jgi:hypothetical protein
MVKTKQSVRLQAGVEVLKARAILLALSKETRKKKDAEVQRSGPFTYRYETEQEQLIKSPFLYGTDHPIRVKDIPSK